MRVDREHCLSFLLSGLRQSRYDAASWSRLKVMVARIASRAAARIWKPVWSIGPGDWRDHQYPRPLSRVKRKPRRALAEFLALDRT